MADAAGGLATGVYWVVTGKLPAEDLKDIDKNKTPRKEPEKKVER